MLFSVFTIKGSTLEEEVYSIEQKSDVEPTDAEAQFNLGERYYEAQDYAEAVKWYRKAAEQGVGEAQRMLGNCYYLGHGVPKDYDEAVQWYRNAIAQGNVNAMIGLGVCYENSNGVPKNIPIAMYWYKKASEQGYSTALENYNRLYDKGYRAASSPDTTTAKKKSASKKR